MRSSLLFIVLLSTLTARSQSYSVGVRTITYIDTVRGSRSIPVELHYPATSAGSSTPLAVDSFPFVVFGHGFQMTASAYYPYADTLAKLGYIVAFPTTESSLSPSHANFAQDLIFVYNTLIKESTRRVSPLYGRVRRRGAIAGHSMGGGAAVLSAQYSCLASCYFTFAAANTNPSAIAAAPQLTQPYLDFAGSYDCIAPIAANQQPMYDSAAASCKFLINIAGASHCNFGVSNFQCNFGQIATSCNNPPLTQANQINTTLAYLKPYLDYYLRGRCSSWAAFEAVYSADVVNTKSRSCSQTIPAGASISGISSFCAGSSATLRAQPSGFSYLWTDGSRLDSIVVSAAAALSVRVSNGVCSVASATTSVVRDSLAPAPTTITGADTLCANADSVAYTTAAVMGAAAYQWSLPSSWQLIAGTTSNSIAIRTSDSAGVISVATVNGCGVSSAVTKQVAIKRKPALTGMILGADSVCSDASVQLYKYIGNASNLLWTAPVGSTLLTYTNSDSIKLLNLLRSDTLRVATGNSCGLSNSLLLPITVVDSPRPSITRVGQSLGSSTLGSQYQWWYNGSPLPADTSPYLNPMLDGRYQLQITNSQGCVGISPIYNYTLTGVEVADKNVLRSYPNPFNEEINIEATTTIEKLEILDNLGRVVHTENKKGGRTLQCSTTSIAGGNYILRLTILEGQLLYQRVTKQ